MKSHPSRSLAAWLLPALLAAACSAPPAPATLPAAGAPSTGDGVVAVTSPATDHPAATPSAAPTAQPSVTPSPVPTNMPLPTPTELGQADTAVPPTPTDLGQVATPFPPTAAPATEAGGTALADTALPPPSPTPSPAPTLPPVPPTHPNAPEQAYVVYSEQALGEYVARVWVRADSPFPDILSLGTIDRGTERLVQIADVAGFEPLPAADLTGEGQHDVAFALRWGGSHCCRGTVLYNLGATPQQVLWVGGEIGAGKFRDLDNDGDWEFITRDVVSGLPCTRPSAMAVLAYSPERGYAPASPQYPAVFEPEILDLTTRAEQRLVENGSLVQCDVSDLLLDYLYSGQAARGWAEFARLYTAPDAADFRATLETAAAKGQLYIAPPP